MGLTVENSWGGVNVDQLPSPKHAPNDESRQFARAETLPDLAHANRIYNLGPKRSCHRIDTPRQPTIYRGNKWTSNQGWQFSNKT